LPLIAEPGRVIEQSYPLRAAIGAGFTARVALELPRPGLLGPGAVCRGVGYGGVVCRGLISRGVVSWGVVTGLDGRGGHRLADAAGCVGVGGDGLLGTVKLGDLIRLTAIVGTAPVGLPLPSVVSFVSFVQDAA
jgi:hypothetical protein